MEIENLKKLFEESRHQKPEGFVLYKGLKETYSNMSYDEISRYLMRCGE